MTNYKVTYTNCNNIRIEETITTVREMHDRVKELCGECEVWLGERKVNINRITANAATTPWHRQ